MIKSILISLFFLPTVIFASESWLLGDWMITDSRKLDLTYSIHYFDAKKLINQNMLFSKSFIQAPENKCSRPVYSGKTLNDNDFRIQYGISIKQLNIQGDSITVTNVSCLGNSYFADMIVMKLENDLAFIVWNGVYIIIKKASDEALDP